MIIECKTCHARFRLDESKIKGKGARVKCRKCGEQIVVFKETESGSAGQAQGGEGSLDLGSALRESSGESASAPRDTPPDNLIHFPKPAARSAEPPEAAGKDEVDMAFEQLLQRTSEPPEEPAPPAPSAEPPAELTFEPPAELTFEPPAAPSAEPPAEPPLEVEEEGTVAPPPPDSPAGDTPEWAVGEDTFDISAKGNSGLSSLKEEQPPEIGKSTDISMAIASSPLELEPVLNLESSAYPASEEEDSAPASEGVTVEGNVTPQPGADEIEIPPSLEEEPGEPAEEFTGALAQPREPDEREGHGPSGPSYGLVAGIALLLALLAAVGYFGFTGSGKRLAGTISPRISGLLGGKDAAKAVSRFEVKNVMGYYDNGAASPRILVIKGQVTNLSSAGKSGIRIFASLLDNTGKVMMEETVYVGNVVSGAKLKTENRESLEKTLANPLGEHLANMDITPGKSVPFMVLFFDAPENIDSYKLEAKDTQ